MMKKLPAENSVQPNVLGMTSTIGYTVLAIELEDLEAAAVLISIIEPFADEVAFNGSTSQGPISAYVGKLSSLLGRHDDAERHLRAALATATAFGCGPRVLSWGSNSKCPPAAFVGPWRAHCSLRRRGALNLVGAPAIVAFRVEH